MGAALQYRMLSTAGISRSTAATALGATGLLSAWILSGLPVLALTLSVLWAPVPQGMAQVAWAGAAVFAAMLVVGVGVTRSDRFMDRLGGWAETVNRWTMARLGREGGMTAKGLRADRDEMVARLGDRFHRALFAAVGNWLLDYLVLVSALLAVGAQPEPHVVLLAYAVAAVLGMVPITPGGLGFVEAGLTATLTLAGIASADALLATLAYRLVSYWLPLPAGLAAYLSFRRRHHSTPPRT